MPMVVLLVTLDTKRDEALFVRDQIRAAGADTLLVDVGIVGQPGIDADISREAVAKAASTEISALVARNDRGYAIDMMGRGAAIIAVRLFAEGRLDSILALGGSGGSSIASAAMRALPIGVPKLLVSTIAAGDVQAYVGQTDIAMMYSVVDVAGLNTVSTRIFENAAAAAAGMAQKAATRKAATGKAASGTSPKPTVAISMFGVTTPAATTARQWLERQGYEVLVFHATGAGGRALEKLAADGALAGVLDLTPTELADELVGGVLSAGPDRLEAAGRRGLPQVVSVGALDMVNFGPIDTVPERFRTRRLYVHNPQVTLMRTTPEECRDLGRILGRKLAQARGPVAVFLPGQGVSLVSEPGGVFHDPDADAALFDALRTALPAHAEIITQTRPLNDPAFATAMATKLDHFIQQRTDHDEQS